MEGIINKILILKKILNTKKGIIKIKPPIVGVPFLLICLSNVLDTFCRQFKLLIKGKIIKLNRYVKKKANKKINKYVITHLPEEA